MIFELPPMSSEMREIEFPKTPRPEIRYETLNGKAFFKLFGRKIYWNKKWKPDDKHPLDEIEKKFKVKQLPSELEKYPHKKIIQGYLCSDPAIRVRQYDDERYELTGKIKREMSEGNKGNVRVNEEINIPLSESAYKNLLKKIDGNKIAKMRYHYPLDNGLIAEIDIFEDLLKGLIIVEVEFPDYETACTFIPPDWFGEDVSVDKRFTNSKLSKVKSIDDLIKDENKKGDN